MRDQFDKPISVVAVLDEVVEVVVARVDAGRADLELVDVLARMRLAFKRRGWAMRLRDVPDDVRGLLQLVGLADVSGVEPRRQAELGEQLGVDEVMEPRDPLA